jgi:hypothetical protein
MIRPEGRRVPGDGVSAAVNGEGVRRFDKRENGKGAPVVHATRHLFLDALEARVPVGRTSLGQRDPCPKLEVTERRLDNPPGYRTSYWTALAGTGTTSVHQRVSGGESNGELLDGSRLRKVSGGKALIQISSNSSPTTPTRQSLNHSDAGPNPEHENTASTRNCKFSTAFFGPTLSTKFCHPNPPSLK